MAKDSGTIVQLQNFSINDGDGIRTTIFLMGCPLRCQWCSNPETWQTTPQNALYKYDYYECKNCGWLQKKADEISSCPNCQSDVSAIIKEKEKILGYEVSVDEIITKIKRQEIFYRFSDGGVTFSGGEPTVQIEFLKELSAKLDKYGIDMWMETCAYFDFDEVKEVLQRLTHIFIDIKCIDEDTHIYYTGISNKLILENIIKIKDLNLPITFRIPSINEVNFTDDNLQKTIDFIKTNFNDYPVDIEFLPYHNLGNEKYQALNLNKHLHEFSAPTKKRIQEVKQLFESNGINTIEYR
ncbi:pyruvate formate lyase activating enzyme [Bacilli bacterium PM5-3]|nr:pyruvate formate lyase activating enzyme [Bacilli bacterium PM5-3]MDH6603127.1 pyruvate formate lyase activating enzyme [Bacilli bacterium PM5-9]